MERAKARLEMLFKRRGKAGKAFVVACDDRNNPPEEQDAGRLVCDLRVKPPAPAEYVVVRKLGDEARSAPGTPEATTKLQQRNQKAQHANLLVGMQEQLIILQPLFDTMMAELTAMNGTMVLHDPNGVHPLANNWGDFYSRMGIDPATAPADPKTITRRHCRSSSRN